MCNEKKHTESPEMNSASESEHTHSSSSSSTEQELQACQEMAAEWKNRFVSVTADFQNFKKRIEKEQAQWTRNAQIRIIEPLLTVIDNMERALEEQKNAPLDQAVKQRLQGFLLIQQELQSLLQRFHVTRMNNYETFNPQYHEALMQVDSPEHTSGQIITVLQQGYCMGEDVVRVAKVSVAR